MYFVHTRKNLLTVFESEPLIYRDFPGGFGTNQDVKNHGLSFYRGVNPSESFYRGVPGTSADSFYRGVPGMQSNLPGAEGWHRGPANPENPFPYFM